MKIYIKIIMAALIALAGFGFCKAFAAYKTEALPDVTAQEFIDIMHGEVARDGSITVVLFSYEGCVHCVGAADDIAQIIEGDNFSGIVKGLKVTWTRANQSTMGQIYKHYAVTETPTVWVFKRGVPKQRVVGRSVKKAEEFKQKITAALNQVMSEQE